ncbi:MAG: hypothetical protein GOMPHAMPRED_000050 [Gomphillus americanus]|uniref:Apurinic-apyrimidinic endonuclease 1 n=1 Tax=Gomphillus americanus TaxID=1940652 RepID=A0A8H3EAN4_9LECA|nr:MAG: hypothetical protein GOMPHAMPRED_000050 [Gomphillus americanus]
MRLKRGAAAEPDANSPSKRVKKTSAAASVEKSVEEAVSEEVSPSKSRRVAKTKVSEPILVAEVQDNPQQKRPKKQAKAQSKEIIEDATSITQVETAVIQEGSDVTKITKVKVTSKVANGTDDKVEAKQKTSSQKQPAKRKSKEEKEAEAMPLKPRTPNLRMFIGSHVSSAGGVQNSVKTALHIGGNAFALFLKSQRKWDNPALKDEHRDEFKNLCGHHNYAADKHVLPHGSYLVNLAQAEADKADQAYACFLDDMKRCDALGIKLYNFHPGNTGPHPRNEAISRIAQQLNKAIKATTHVIPVLETMAGQGNAIGSSFEDLRDIISGVEDKTRVGVCIDTCHIFAAGYDIRTSEAFEKTINSFDEIVGLKYLRAFHMNDSKAPFGSHRDLHQNIGLGFLGLRAFHSIMNEPRFEGLPMILETPSDADNSVWATEIKLLESLIGMDASSEDFLALENDLAARGSAERVKFQEQVDKKAVKEKKKSAGGQKRKRKANEEDSDMTE